MTRRTRLPDLARTLALPLAAALLALALPACTGGRDALTIYSGRTSNLVGPLLERFYEETGIDIDVKYGDSAELALQIAEEGERSPADVFFSQSPGAVGFLARQGRLAQLDQSLLGKVDARFRAPNGRWVGVTGRQRVLVYNTELVREEDLPRSVFELTEPRYAGKVALAPSNGSFQDFVTAMRALRGDEATLAWLEGMARNGSPTYANNNAIVEAVGRGEVPMGLVNHYYNYRFLEENPDQPTRNHTFPADDPGALVIPSSVSILASADKREEAERFVNFLLSEEAQRYFSEETFEYPLAAGVQPSAGLPPLEQVEGPDVDVDQLGGGLERTLELIRDAGFTGV